MSHCQFSLGGAVPYQMRMSGDMLSKASEDCSNDVYNFSENISPLSYRMKTIAFPPTKAVLWNRNPIGPAVKLCALENTSSVKLLFSERTLQLAYKQLCVTGEYFDGFCIGELQIQDSQISIIIDRFDPGRDGYINTESGAQQKIRIPTISIPGDLNIPTQLCSGIAFVDHVSTQTHSCEEFIKDMQVLESWCSRKDKLDVNNLFTLKIKCCFQDDNDEILTYITCGMLFINEEFSLLPINSIPIIPTALARNLEGPVSVSVVQSHVKTGFITMDQTRKLLLLLETDPKAYSLPLVGVWVSGVRDINSPEVWACCTRFIHNRNIEEKVYAPPNNYLLVVYAIKSACAIFHEFSRTDTKYNVNFHFLTCCEGVAICKSNMQTVNDEYTFDLVNMATCALTNTFKKSFNEYNNNGDDNAKEKMHGAKEYELSTSSHDDSIPLDCPVHSPLPQIQSGTYQSFPSVPDLSMCESLVMEPLEGSNDIKNTNNCVPKKVQNKSAADCKSVQVNKKHPSKHPRQTKASLARMDINKHIRNAHDNCQKKANLAISFNNPKKKEKESERDVGQVTANDANISGTVDMSVLGNNTLKLPVKIRQNNELQDSITSSHLMEESHIKESEDVAHDNINGNVQPPPYFPQYYSDASVEESFIFNSCKNNFNESEDPVSPCLSLQGDKCENEKSDIKTELDVIDVDEGQPGLSVAPLQNASPQEIIKISENNNKIHSDHAELKKSDKDSTISDITKDDLYDLVKTQQEQLSNLQAQLEIFLKHQNIGLKEKTLGKEKEDVEKEKREVEVSSELSSIQEMQRVQLNALQLQVQEFLNSSKSPDKKDTSSQCSMGYEAPQTFHSIAVNTGDSLFLPIDNVPCAKSAKVACGCGKDEVICEKVIRRVGKKESFCSHCISSHCLGEKRNKERYKFDSSITSNGYSGIVQVSSPSLSDVCTEDIASSIFEDTANSSQSVSSFLKEVDMPVYDESQNMSSPPTRQMKNKNDWDTSPVLGESASMLNRNNGEMEDMNQVNDPVNNKEFYSQVMSQVQKLIEAQNISTESNSICTDTDKEDSVSSSNILTDSKEVSIDDVTTPEEDLQHIRDVTVKQLNEIINQSCESESVNLFTEQKDCAPTGIIATLPRINYMSMAVDETLFEESNFNTIAAKYLKDEMIETRNKTVKFEGVCELNTPGKTLNMSSVNFSCNMSIATKKYLQRYELIDRENIPTQPLGEVNGRVSRKIKHVNNNSRSYSESDKENILDFKKLRSLPKLL